MHQRTHSGAKRASHHLPNPYSKRHSSSSSQSIHPTMEAMQGQPQQLAAPQAVLPPQLLRSVAAVKLEPGVHIAAPGAGLLSGTTATTHIKQEQQQQHTPQQQQPQHRGGASASGHVTCHPGDAEREIAAAAAYALAAAQHQAAAAAAAARRAAGIQLKMEDVVDELRASVGPAAAAAAAAHLGTWAVLLGFANSSTFSSMPVVLLLSELSTVLDRVKAELACTSHIKAADGCLLALQRVLYLPAVQAEVGQAQLARLQAQLTAAIGEVRATAAAAAAAPVHVPAAAAAATAIAAAAAARHPALVATMAWQKCTTTANSDSAAAGATRGAATSGSGPQDPPEPPEPAGLNLTQLEEHLRSELHHNQPDLVARWMLPLQCIAELSGDTSSSDALQVPELIRQCPLLLQHLESETKLARVAPAAASLCCTHLANVLTLPVVRSTFTSQSEVAEIHAQVVAASRKYKQAAAGPGAQTEGKPSSSTATERTGATPAAPPAATPAAAAVPTPVLAPAAAPPSARPPPMSVQALSDKLRAMGRTDAAVVSRLLRTIACLVSGGDGSSTAADADAIGSQAVAPLLLEMTALVPYLQQRIANGELAARTGAKYLYHLLNLLEVPIVVEQLLQQQLGVLRQQMAAARREFNAASSIKPTQLQSPPAPGSCRSNPGPEATAAAATLLPESLWSTLPLQKVQQLARTLALLAQLVADDATATSPAAGGSVSLAKLLRQWRLLHAAAATVPDEGCVHMDSLLQLLSSGEVQNELASEHEVQHMLQQMAVAKQQLDRAVGGLRPLSQAPSTAAAAAGDAVVERQQESAGTADDTHIDAAAAVRRKAAAGAAAKGPPARQGSGNAAASGLKLASPDAAARPGMRAPQAPGVALAAPMPPALAAPPQPSFPAAERYLLRRFAQPPDPALKPSITELMMFRNAMRLLPTLARDDSRVVCFGAITSGLRCWSRPRMGLRSVQQPSGSWWRPCWRKCAVARCSTA
jgi:hypothetical protein